MKKGRDYWSRHVAAWRQSGQSRKAYCEEHGLSYWEEVSVNCRVDICTGWTCFSVTGKIAILLLRTLLFC